MLSFFADTFEWFKSADNHSHFNPCNIQHVCWAVRAGRENLVNDAIEEARHGHVDLNQCGEWKFISQTFEDSQQDITPAAYLGRATPLTIACYTPNRYNIAKKLLESGYKDGGNELIVDPNAPSGRWNGHSPLDSAVRLNPEVSMHLITLLLRHRVRPTPNGTINSQRSWNEWMTWLGGVYSKSAVIRYRQGFIKHYLGAYEGAIVDFTATISFQSEYMKEAYCFRGNSNSALGNHQESISDYNASITIDPQYTLAYYGRGKANYVLGRYEAAFTDLNRAIQLNANCADAYYLLGKMKESTNHHSEAMTDYTSAIEKYNDIIVFLGAEDDVVDAYYGRSQAKWALGNREEAIEDYDHAIEIIGDTARGNNIRLEKERLLAQAGLLLHPANPQ